MLPVGCYRYTANPGGSSVNSIVMQHVCHSTEWWSGRISCWSYLKSVTKYYYLSNQIEKVINYINYINVQLKQILIITLLSGTPSSKVTTLTGHIFTRRYRKLDQKLIFFFLSSRFQTPSSLEESPEFLLNVDLPVCFLACHLKRHNKVSIKICILLWGASRD